MAKQVTVELVDDFDPTQTAAETVEFSIDGRSYEIDLSETNAETLRSNMQPWIDAARRVAGRRTHAIRTPARSADKGLPLAEIRAWAQENGYEVSSRGRVPAAIVRAYKDATDTEPANVTDDFPEIGAPVPVKEPAPPTKDGLSARARRALEKATKAAEAAKEADTAEADPEPENMPEFSEA